MRFLPIILLVARTAAAGDWPAHLHDNARTGVGTETLALPLTPHWSVKSAAVPTPAWPEPQPGWTELPKVAFDDAFYAVADADTVYFGSSVDNSVHAVEASTGKERWRFITGGPIRLAPALAEGRVHFGSDDGRVYCVKAADGTLVWSFDAAPEARRVLGSGRSISLWPVRTGVVVQDGKVFCGSGVFPYHRVYLFALDAATGAVAWKNDSVKLGGGFSPQGYMASTAAGGLVVLSGRESPVCVSRADGALQYAVAHTKDKGGPTGSYAVTVGSTVFVGTQNALYGFNSASGEAAGKWTPADRIIAVGSDWYILKGPPPPSYGRKSIAGTQNDVTCVDREAWGKLAKKDAPGLKSVTRWRLPKPDAESIIVSGDHLIIGSKNDVTIVDRKSGKPLWNAPVDGLAAGLAVAHGRLIVSTTQGTIHCFAVGAAPAAAKPVELDPRTVLLEIARTSQQRTEARCARQTSGVRVGYALVFGSTELAFELARNSDLIVTRIEFDRTRLDAERRKVPADLYGHRVTVEAGTPDALPFPDYAANLIVQWDGSASAGELVRVLKPCGGVLQSRTPISPLDAPKLAQALGMPKDVEIVGTAVMQVQGLKSLDLRTGFRAAQYVRGDLVGSGWWTHQYGDAGGSGSSGDKLVKGRLDVLWYGAPGADEFPDRHTRGTAPLVCDGRVYCQGWNFLSKTTKVFCFDAYNGVRYWSRDIEGAVRLNLPAVSGNLACDASGVFVATGSKCVRLDAITGETKAEYTAGEGADANKAWAYLAVVDGKLIGSTTRDSQPRFSDTVFAIDLATGKRLWTMRTKEILDTTMAVESGRLLYAENRGKPSKAVGGKAAEGSEAPEELPEKDERRGKPGTVEPYLRTIVARNIVDGSIVWEKEYDLTDCGRWAAGAFGTLQTIAKDGVMILAGAYTIYGRPVEGPPKKALAVNVRDGSPAWNSVLGNKSRPVALQGALLAEPVFFDIKTGIKLTKTVGNKTLPWSMGPRTGGCGSLSASDHMVFGRGGCTVWRDVTGGGSGAFVGMRPGCLINIIPAGGVVVSAEASSGCSCYQAVQCTVVFKPR